MIELLAKERIRRVLCLGAHSDDIEIGCGGTILKLLAGSGDITVRWVVFTAKGEREAEAKRGAELFLKGAAKQDVTLHSFRDGFLPYEGAAVKESIEALKRDFAPDVIFTHCRDDFHQDHALLASMTWNTFRDHLILEYEIPKYDGDMGRPNIFVRLDDDVVKQKVAHLAAAFKSQSGKHWFDEELFRGLMRLRGMECASPSRFAEAFVCRKMLL